MEAAPAEGSGGSLAAGIREVDLLTFAMLGIGGPGFVADPFIVGPTARGQRVLFEVLEGYEGPGPSVKYIGSADVERDEDRGTARWRYLGPAIREDGRRLAFPYTFEHDGTLHCVPDATDLEGVPVPLGVYRLESGGWTRCATLEVAGSDPVVFRYRERWWMCVGKLGDRLGGLRLYRSDSPLGGWERVGRRPMVRQRPLIRMGGRPLIDGTTVWLPFQCREKGEPYGAAVRYVALGMRWPVPRVRAGRRGPRFSGPGGEAWCADGMHHVDVCPDGRFLVTDGRRNDREDMWRIGPRWSESDLRKTLLHGSGSGLRDVTVAGRDRRPVRDERSRFTRLVRRASSGDPGGTRSG